MAVSSICAVLNLIVWSFAYSANNNNGGNDHDYFSFDVLNGLSIPLSTGQDPLSADGIFSQPLPTWNNTKLDIDMEIDNMVLEEIVPEDMTDQDSSQSQNTPVDPETQYNQIKKLMQQIDSQLEHPKIREMRFQTILQTFQAIAAGNDACINLSEDTGKLKETEKVSGNANNILQPRFHTTEKKKGRPKKVPLRKPTEEEKEHLLSHQDMPQPPLEETVAPVHTLPSVAPYPPLRLVRTPSTSTQLPSTPEQPLFEVNGQLGLQPWMRVPPSLIGRRIKVKTKDGKTQVLIFTKGVTDTNNNLH
ncbi:uncharacterized protein LOC133206326 isoform X2 [Saccostrea echinata]|uniref:uncharacterized protein LOC133206326 isoform X2 n=1 Tax=Saccostrea echinata TaxID=191078 RepID=UPI002A83A699|nr:uncharacterized protein LOC133206326 isoform X2 [Saccostrea echinata]